MDKIMTYVHLRTGNQYEVYDYSFRFKHKGTWHDAVRYNRNGQGYARSLQDFKSKFGRLGEVAECSKGHRFTYNEQAEKGMGYVKCQFCDEHVTQAGIIGPETLDN